MMGAVYEILYLSGYRVNDIVGEQYALSERWVEVLEGIAGIVISILLLNRFVRVPFGPPNSKTEIFIDVIIITGIWMLLCRIGDFVASLVSNENK